ncbi:similar to stage IV sporulation protein [Anoxybacillus pushchinoensis]|uniref:Similar to stage IV sporulation protein n=1 Tax=Anoxybacillus pushchinoensis TaxID=150248 RepID=A0A1I0TQR2_9BACL|nr:sporulation protein YqfD [Anoxybacillus pushchinoensis]SFA54089.1 similar to stage IV sporulation protein [Anoxybacillus pushchinoensis]
MKNEWMYRLSGNLRIRIVGKGLERLLNECTRRGIYIWDVRREGEHSLTCYIFLRDLRHVRIAMRKSGCKLYILERKGAPFWVKASWKNSGIVVGLVVFICIVFLLSNMVWRIEVTGGNAETEHAVRQQLKKIGVERGALQFVVPTPESIQKTIMNNIDTITWIGVEWRGTTLYCQVVEKKQPKQTESHTPQHLVAKKKAVITYMFVEQGQAVVEVHDHVVPGQLLVSGFIGKEGQTEIVPARGQILGETWYKSTVVVPMKTTFYMFTGKKRETHYLRLWSWKIPFFWNDKEQFSQFEKQVDEKTFRFLTWTLPVIYEKVVWREKEVVVREYSYDEAKLAAKQIAREQLKRKLPADATIQGEKVLHEAKENGKVKVEMHYQVIENIAIPQPIIQGD